MSGLINLPGSKSFLIGSRKKITMSGSYTSYAGQPLYSTRICNVVYLHGCIVLSNGDTSVGDNMATLGVGHRPPDTIFLGIVGNGDDLFFININTSGVIQVSDVEELGRGEGDDMIPLDGLSFLTTKTP